MKIKMLPLVSGLLLAWASLAVAQARTGTVIAERASLRDGPSQTAILIEAVPVGTTVKVLDEKGAWYVVRIEDAVGWMHGNTFRFEAAPSSQQSNVITLEEASPSRPVTRPSTPTSTSNDSTPRSNSGRYIRGPRGGCYYLSSSGKKVYVDHSLCN